MSSTKELIVAMSAFSSAFTKYHGNGNDFIIFDATKQNAIGFHQLIIDNAQRLCHRNRGIGADGIIVLDKSNARFHMTIINADGSLASNCGNGLRCLADYLFKEHKIASPLEIVLNDKVFSCSKIGDEVSVAMGQCRVALLDEVSLPSLPGPAKRALGHIGNDHLVILVETLGINDDLVVAELQRTTKNASDLNIGLLSIEASGRMRSRVFERGVGWTDSCATGACIAASFLAVAFPKTKGPFIISQPGGDISVNVSVVNQAGSEAICDIVQQGKVAQIFMGICQLEGS